MSDPDDSRSLSERRVGRVLRGKYHLDRLIGVGGMAAVYAATHRNGKRFAVKVLHASQSTNSSLRARFLREGYVANAVNHPGVVAVLDDDTDEQDGAAFLVMELLDGVTVETLCPPGGPGLPVAAALAILLDLLDVLAAAHARQIVHRDIKPANLCLLRDGRLKVLDFGIARLRDEALASTSTQTGQVLGTPAFMAPEQALGEGNNIDERTDVWAAGATLFTLLSGQIVHAGDNSRQVLVRAATTPARSLASAAPEVPAEVVRIVDKALAFERADRWESAAAMREAVQRAHAGLHGAPPQEVVASLLTSVAERAPTALAESVPHRVSADTVLERPSPLTPRRLVVAAVFSALLALGIWALAPSPSTPEQPPTAESVRAAGEPPPPSVLPVAPDVSDPVVTSTKEHAALEPAAVPSTSPPRLKPRPVTPKREVPAAPTPPAPAASVRPKNPLNIELQ